MQRIGKTWPKLQSKKYVRFLSPKSPKRIENWKNSYAGKKDDGGVRNKIRTEKMRQPKFFFCILLRSLSTRSSKVFVKYQKAGAKAIKGKLPNDSPSINNTT